MDDEDVPIYAGSDGSLYTGWTMYNEGKGGRWKPVLWDNDAGWSLKWDTRSEELVWYIETTLAELPDWVGIDRHNGASRVIDRREE